MKRIDLVLKNDEKFEGFENIEKGDKQKKKYNPKFKPKDIVRCIDKPYVNSNNNSGIWDKIDIGKKYIISKRYQRTSPKRKHTRVFYSFKEIPAKIYIGCAKVFAYEEKYFKKEKYYIT